LRFFGRCGECVIDVVDQFIERAIAVAQVVGDHLAISADDEEMGDRLYGIEVRDAGGAVSHDVDLPIGRGSFDRGECLVRIAVAHRKYDESVLANQPLCTFQNGEFALAGRTFMRPRTLR